MKGTGHSDENPYMDNEYCIEENVEDESFNNTKESREVESVQVHSINEKEIGNRKISAWESSKIHTVALQKNPGSLDCPECGRTFTQNCQLLLHIRSIHQGVKHQCNFCEHRATTKSNLKAHVKTRHPEAHFIVC